MIIQRWTGSTWKTFTTVTLDASSAFRYRWTPASTGTWRFRATIAAQANSGVGLSATRTIVIR